MYDLIKDNNFEGFSMDMVRKYAAQILHGLKYMRNLSIIHCDLKPENILMTDRTNQQLRVIDFGSS
jgi:dual specificity tyrosine-phosphorylation-regulated kinase 2/3/4